MRPETVASLFQYVPEASAIEKDVVEAMPAALDEAGAMALLVPARSREWFRLYGALLSVSCSALEAAHQQVAVDIDPSYLLGLRSALRNAGAAEVVECGLEIADPRLAQLAGEAIASEPALLAGVDMACQKAQAVWREALAIDPKSWQGPTDPVAAFHSILDCMLESGDADTSLIALLSDTPLADLGTYPRRPEVWSRISGTPLNNLLAGTAKGWLQAASRARKPPFVPEDTLQFAILESDGEVECLLDALIPARSGAAVGIVSALSGYNEQRFLRWIDSVLLRTDSLAGSDAEAIGRLLVEREWRQAASDMVWRYRSGRPDLRPLLRTCYDMLGFWDRFTLNLTRVSESEKWRALESLAAELYPGGPDDQGLWERAGGKDADLPSKGAGRSRWRQGIRDMRRGRQPAPSVLLAEMMEDFPNNEQLVHLAGDDVFRSKRRKRRAKQVRRKSAGERV